MRLWSPTRRGATGKTGSQGIGLVGRQGPVGERGKLGDHGQDGTTGPQGERGKPGKSIALWQAFAMFLLILVVGLALAYKLDQQQQEITANSQRLAETQYQSCVNGAKILDSFNRQQERLARLERQQTTLPQLRVARARLYLEGRILPLPVCRR